MIGAPKSGTTSLFYYLKQHPAIYLPVRKELHYFSYNHLVKRLNGPGDRDALVQLCSSRNDYESHYRNAGAEKAIGEVSPSYLYYSDVAQTIRNTLGPVKIIVLLRNPVERAYSQYMHLVRDQREKLSFYESLLAEKQRKKDGWSDIWLYAETSLYSKNIKQYISIFGRENVNILFFDDFVANTEKIMIEIFSYLNIDSQVKCDVKKIYNKTGEIRIESIALFLSKQSKFKSYIKIFIPETLRIYIRLAALNWNTGAKPKIDKQSFDYLARFFSKDISKLEEIIGHDLDWPNK